MLRIGKLTDYAIVILGHMARRPGQIYAAADLAQWTGVAATTVSKVLKALTRAEVLTSTRGVKGGYQLARPPDQTSVASIIYALEGPIALTECELEHDSCQKSSSCRIRSNWTVINRAIRAALESVTLADMATPMAKAPEAFYIPLESLFVPPKRFVELD
ncbi:SUF system Fe-S cluster assembly regulator [Candidatus Methylocalor cossyra]|uniref:Iron-sulfur cluster regulator IscR n=1 Tax=Candidatus Methylocalor cossyra TaxID=3108543 RepID=A0ABM9NLP4_9GAMM